MTRTYISDHLTAEVPVTEMTAECYRDHPRDRRHPITLVSAESRQGRAHKYVVLEAHRK